MRAWLRDAYETSAPTLMAIFGACLMAVGFEVEGSAATVICLFFGGLIIAHGVEMSALRAGAKAEQRFSRELIDMLMDGRDVKITVTHEGKQ